MGSDGNDSKITIKGLIDFYENLLSSGKVKIPGAAQKRLVQLKERHRQRYNKYYYLKQKWGKDNG